MKTLDELMGWRRSVRQFDAQKGISKEEIVRLIEAAMEAPSWKNRQTTRYHVVMDTNLKQRVAQCMHPQNLQIVEGASAVVVVSFKQGIVGFERNGEPTNELGNGWGIYDCGLHNAFFLLKAADMGIDTIVLGLRDARQLRLALGIPDEETIVSVIALGHRAEEPQRPPRKSLDAIATFHE